MTAAAEDASASLVNALTQALFGRASHPHETTDGLDAVVDQVTIHATPFGPRAIRLSCMIAPTLPETEDALRGMLASYLPYADHGDEVLCVDDQGQLMLIADIRQSGDLKPRLAAFCDAAVHWRRSVTTTRPRRLMPTGPLQMIFP